MRSSINQAIRKQFKKHIVQPIHNVEKITKSLIYGRDGYSPKVKSFLQTYGDEIITHLVINRDPIPKAIQSTLNWLSMGKVAHDKLFHLRLNVTTQSGTQFIMEKNEVINIQLGIPKPQQGGEHISIAESPQISVNQWLDNTQNFMGDKYFRYSGSSNNCQDFILANLHSNSIRNSTYDDFIKQDTTQIFKNNPTLRKFSNTITDIAGRADVLVQGGGITKILHKCQCKK